MLSGNYTAALARLYYDVASAALGTRNCTPGCGPWTGFCRGCGIQAACWPPREPVGLPQQGCTRASPEPHAPGQALGALPGGSARAVCA